MSFIDDAKDAAEAAGKKVGDVFDDVKENLADAKDHASDALGAIKKDVAAEFDEHKAEGDADAAPAAGAPAATTE